MVFDIFTLVEGFWLILPAYAANGLAPLAKFLQARHPLDGGRLLGGQPLLGEGKTWEGTLIGVAAAVTVSLIQMLAFPFLPWQLSEQLHGITLQIVPMGPLLGLLLGAGAMGGDLGKSFLKRRLGIRRGAPLPVLDQDDFVLGAFAAAALLVPISLDWVTLFLIITPLVHWTACVIGYRLKVKQTPW